MGGKGEGRWVGRCTGEGVNMVGDGDRKSIEQLNVIRKNHARLTNHDCSSMSGLCWTNCSCYYMSVFSFLV